jgi:hypothetical protein
MISERIEFWVLLTVSCALSITPIYPSILLWWLCVSLIWYNRFGPSWYRHNLESDESHFFIFDVIVCLPLIVCMLLAIAIEQLRKVIRG